jgi:8-oxo-dGTP diphosphatase
MSSSHANIKLLIFTIVNGTLQVFLVDREIPSSVFEKNKSLDDTAWGMYETLFLDAKKYEGYMEQLYTINDSGVICIVYYLLIHAVVPKKNTGSFIDVIEHIVDKDSKTVQYSLQRLRWKIEYTNVVYSLLSEEFTLSDLQKTYEAILGKQLDKRNFRKKILSLGIIKSTGKKRKGSAARPAEVYSFKERKPAMVKVF